ncbi:MAG: restriction endonuclease subunit S [Anaerolineales bacterium]|nr:restriction endonuclease subunit S [Anaerolineales bacterium]
MMTNETEKRQLPDGWAWTPFGELFEIQGGSQPPKDTFIYEPKEGYIRLLQIRDFGDKPVPTYIPIDQARKTCERYDVLIARYGASLGRILTGMEGAYNVAMAKVIFDHGLINSRYIFYLLQTPIFQTPIHMISRSAQNGFNKGDVYPIELPVAPLPEQERIVAEIEKQFTRLDQAVASLQRLQSNLARYKASVLKAACDGRLVPQDPNDEPAADLLARILSERRTQWEAANPKKKYKEPVGVETAVLPDLPESWVWARVDQLGEVRLGRQRSPKNHQGPHMHPYLRAANATWNGVDLSDVMEMNFKPSELETYRLKKGDILLSEASGSANEVGKPFIWKEQIPDCCFQNTLIRVRLFDLPPDYLHLHFYTDAQTGRFGRIAKGVGIHHLGANRLAEMPVAIPPLAEQERIVAEVERRLSVITATEQIITANLARAERLRQSILHRAFTGQLVPQQPA